MNKYFRSSYYCPDDKDVYDFLKATKATGDSMLKFLREQGIYASSRDTSEHLCDHISTYYLDWHAAEKLVDLVNVREGEDAQAGQDVPWNGKFTDIGTAAQAVQELRSVRDRETYVIEQTGDKCVVKISYVDVENGKTRLLQQRDKELTLTIESRPNGFHIRHDNVPRADVIISNLLGILAQPNAEEEKQELKPSQVELTAIRTAKGRVDFFKKMMDGIDGLTLREVTHIRTERMPRAEIAEEEDEAEREEAEETVRRIVMYGRRLWETKEFRDLVDKGFFASSATWRAEQATASREHIDVTVGFNQAIEGKDFHYKILGVYNRDDQGDLRPSRERLPKQQQAEIFARLEAGAAKALREVLAAQEPEPEASNENQLV
jgi:hypothetical protein